jgi:acid phosphatase family membrane protein YuiD
VSSIETLDVLSTSISLDEVVAITGPSATSVLLDVSGFKSGAPLGSALFSALAVALSTSEPADADVLDSATAFSPAVSFAALGVRRRRGRRGFGRS